MSIHLGDVSLSGANLKISQMHLVPISCIYKCTQAGRLLLDPKLAYSFSWHRKGQGKNNHTAATNLCSHCCQQHSQEKGKRRLGKMDAMGFESWGLWEELPVQGVWHRGGLPQREDAVIYRTSAGDTDETMVTGGGRRKSCLCLSLTADGTQSQDYCSVHLAALAWLTIP